MQGDADLLRAPFLAITGREHDRAYVNYRIDVERSDGTAESRFPLEENEQDVVQAVQFCFDRYNFGNADRRTARLYRQDPDGDVLVGTYERTA